MSISSIILPYCDFDGHHSMNRTLGMQIKNFTFVRKVKFDRLYNNYDNNILTGALGVFNNTLLFP